MATTSADHSVNIWSMKDFSLLKTLTGHQRWVWDCVYSHDSDFLVTGVLCRLSISVVLCDRVFFDRLVAASSDNTLRLWDLELGESIRQYTGHSKAIVCVALSEDTTR